MARVFNVNIVKSTQARSGFSLFRLKDLLLSTERWSVVGSGDGTTRYAYYGITVTLPLDQQGPGGSFDCLKTGTGVSGTGAGDWGLGGWCVFRDEGGREVLVVDSTGVGDASWNSYGRVAYSRVEGFDGSSASPTTIPAAALDEQWVLGARAAPTGAQLFHYNQAGFLHLYAHNIATNGVSGFGWISATSAGVVGNIFAFSATKEFDANGAGDPCVFFTSGNFYGWSSAGTQWQTWDATCTVSNPVGTSFPVEPQGGKDPVSPVYIIASPVSSDTVITASDLGYPIDILVDRCSTSRAHPVRFEADGSSWISVTANNNFFPWPLVTVPLSGTDATISVSLFKSPYTWGYNVVPVNQELIPVMYFQRVRDTSTNLWCYYSKDVIDPNPATLDTSPNHSGSIVGHSILKVVVG